MAPLVVGTEDVAFGARRRQVAVVGSTREFLEVRKLAVARGEFLPAAEMQRGRSVAVLGTKVAQELFPGEEAVGRIVRIGGWRMRVIGVLAPRGVQLGMNVDDVVVVPVGTAMKMFDRRSLFRIFIQVRGTADLERTKQKVIRLFVERHDGEEDVTILTQDAVVSTFSQILGALTLAVGAIAAISLTVAGIGIMNVMLVAVAERTREIGLLRAVGVGRRQVLAVFLTEAALLSAAGGLLGLARRLDGGRDPGRDLPGPAGEPAALGGRRGARPVVRRRAPLRLAAGAAGGAAGSGAGPGFKMTFEVSTCAI